jgi:hypothetical protein
MMAMRIPNGFMPSDTALKAMKSSANIFLYSFSSNSMIFSNLSLSVTIAAHPY